MKILTIQLTDDEHTTIKLEATKNGKSMKAYLLDSLNITYPPIMHPDDYGVVESEDLHEKMGKGFKMIDVPCSHVSAGHCNKRFCPNYRGKK